MWINKTKYIIKKKFFDQNFGLGAKYGSAEETDYVLNALLDNRKILFSPSIKIFHPTNVKSSKEYMKYAFGNGAIYKKFLKKNNLLFLRIFLKSILISTILFMFYCLLLNKNKSAKYIIFLVGRVSGFIKYKY